MNNNFGTLFFNLLSNMGDYSDIQTIHCNTRFLVPIIAITPFEQVLAVPDLESWNLEFTKNQHIDIKIFPRIILDF